MITSFDNFNAARNAPGPVTKSTSSVRKSNESKNFLVNNRFKTGDLGIAPKKN